MRDDTLCLTKPLPSFSLKSLRYGLARLCLSTFGRLSKGIRIGYAHGFDSGVMLDHVYADRAEGTTPLGRLIDRIYLDAPGWVGIRNRGALLRRVIEEEAAVLAGGRGSVALADLACGGGRYLLQAVAALRRRGIGVRARLRDYRQENVERALENARRLEVEAVVEQADAFDDDALAELAGSDIVVVSGLHEIIPRDDRVRRHFGQIFRILPEGGRLILTVQPHHPQLEFIARVLVSHSGRPWVMRLRSLEVTRCWLQAAGFTVERLEMEPKGIFGVLVARKD